VTVVPSAPIFGLVEKELAFVAENLGHGSRSSYGRPCGVTDILPVRITQHELFVYAADLHCIARHELALRGKGLRLDPAGLHPAPQRKSPIDRDQLSVAFAQMGERSAAFFRLMTTAPPRIWGYQARQILLLRERFATADLDAALGHAALFGALDHHAVERIVTAHASPRRLDEYVAEHTVQRMAQALGETRTGPRDLTEYDRLPGAGATAALRTSSAAHHETTPWPNEMVPIDRRHSRVSTAATSNIALSGWGRYLGDATVAMAILDRLAMHAIRIDIDGPSYRQHLAGHRARRPRRSPAPSPDLRSSSRGTLAPLQAFDDPTTRADWLG
jgi:hypothetical protein